MELKWRWMIWRVEKSSITKRHCILTHSCLPAFNRDTKHSMRNNNPKVSNHPMSLSFSIPTLPVASQRENQLQNPHLQSNPFPIQCCKPANTQYYTPKWPQNHPNVQPWPNIGGKFKASGAPTPTPSGCTFVKAAFRRILGGCLGTAPLTAGWYPPVEHITEIDQDRWPTILILSLTIWTVG